MPWAASLGGDPDLSRQYSPWIKHPGVFGKGDFAVGRPFATDRDRLDAFVGFQLGGIREQLEFEQAGAVLRIRRVIVNQHAAAMPLERLCDVKSRRFLHNV